MKRIFLIIVAFAAMSGQIHVESGNVFAQTNEEGRLPSYLSKGDSFWLEKCADLLSPRDPDSEVLHWLYSNIDKQCVPQRERNIYGGGRRSIISKHPACASIIYSGESGYHFLADKIATSKKADSSKFGYGLLCLINGVGKENARQYFTDPELFDSLYKMNFEGSVGLGITTNGYLEYWKNGEEPAVARQK